MLPGRRPPRKCSWRRARMPPDETSETCRRLFRSYQLHVDRRGSHLVSFSNVGVWMEFDEAARTGADIVSDHSDRETVIEEIEQQLVLLLARAWAGQGWTPLHAGSLIPPGKTDCVLVCAPSGAGKTTLIAALLRRGWRTLGDDKKFCGRRTVASWRGLVPPRSFASRAGKLVSGNREILKCRRVTRAGRKSAW